MRVNKKRIQEWKEANDYTFEDIYDILGENYSFLSGVMHNDTMPRADRLARLAYIMGCWSEDLLVEEKGDFPSV